MELSFKSFMRSLSSLLGGLSLTVGIMLIFLALLGMNIIKNVDNLDDVVQESMMDYLEEHNEEAKELILMQLEEQGFDISQFNQESVGLACMNRELLDPQMKTIISSDLCQQAGSMNDQQIQDYIVDKIVGQNQEQLMQNGIPEEGSQEIKKSVNQIIKEIGNLNYLIFAGILLFIIGGVLTFVSVKFHFLRGTYRLMLKTSVNLLTIGLFLLIFKYIGPETILKLIEATSNVLSDTGMQNVPPEMMNVVINVILGWLQLSTNPLINIAFIAAVPFVIVTVVLLLKRFRDKGEMKGKESVQKEEVV